ncbi:hypothetical protein NQ317_005074 [Molorchus minor]|uniref:Cytochrome P450 n=1 Tax=Molorchus minor TaxID=1323400 RepID=A0ABQ9JXL9_9CUCU|nr:hypothetical protein NQ317_005074 [Molorchus minor]
MCTYIVLCPPLVYILRVLKPLWPNSGGKHEDAISLTTKAEPSLSVMGLKPPLPAIGRAPWTTHEILLASVVSIALIWWLQFLWSRRRLYESARKLQGPTAYPLIGASHNLIGDAYGITCKFMALFKQYPGIFKLWHGLRLLYGISDPNYFQILLPRCLDKEEWYQFSYPAVGHGLFTSPVYKWKRQRKMIMPMFNQKILDSFVTIFSEQSDIFADQLKKRIGKGGIRHFLFDVKSGLGVKVHTQTTDAPFLKWVESFFEGMFLKIFVFWYHFEFIFKRTKMAKEFYQGMDNIHNFGKNVVRDKLKALKEKQTELGLDLHLIENSETILCNLKKIGPAIFHFSKKVYEEVMDIIGPDRPVEARRSAAFKIHREIYQGDTQIVSCGQLRCKGHHGGREHVLVKGTSAIFNIYSVHTHCTPTKNTGPILIHSTQIGFYPKKSPKGIPAPTYRSLTVREIA